MRMLRNLAPRARWSRAVLAFAGMLGILALAVGTWAFVQVRSSLPVLEGAVMAPELSAPVAVARDTQGVPTLTWAHPC
jgi:acyl-homoserine lactone acylase PvdQ